MTFGLVRRDLIYSQSTKEKGYFPSELIQSIGVWQSIVKDQCISNICQVENFIDILFDKNRVFINFFFYY